METLDQKFWEKYFKVYDVLNIVIPYQELLSELEKEIDLNREDIVLDISSGTGNLMMKIKNNCKKTIGIDFSEAGIKTHKIKDPSAEAIVCDITKGLNFPDNYFTKVVSNNVIYTLNSEQQEKVLYEMKRVLRPGGKLVISNVVKNFSPIKIYTYHVKKSIKKFGIIKTIIMFFGLVLPTLKMFYYNAKIKNSGLSKQYNFLEKGEQGRLLMKSGFAKVSGEKFVYADQAIMNSCYKL